MYFAGTKAMAAYWEARVAPALTLDFQGAAALFSAAGTHRRRHSSFAQESTLAGGSQGQVSFTETSGDLNEFIIMCGQSIIKYKQYSHNATSLVSV